MKIEPGALSASATSMMTTLVPQTETKPCPCGCAPCDEACCRLDCLDRPNFFCGQLLTDQDLTALTEWSLDKHRLKRYVDGWGVVCGLDVRCDPKNPLSLVVTPGYALSCCGDDIIVCDETQVDLSPCCITPKDPCAEPRTEPDFFLAGGPAPPTMVSIGGFDFRDDEVRAVDIILHYAEENYDLATALGRSACGESGACEPRRVRESFRLDCRPAKRGCTPNDIEAERWKERWRQCCEIVETIRAIYATLETDRAARNFESSWKETALEIKRCLLAWIEEHPMREFCFIESWIKGLGVPSLPPLVATNGNPWLAEKMQLPQILFLLVQDCRNSLLHCSCHDCETCDGVPIARALIHRPLDPTSDCTVLTVSPYEPYRRMIGLDSCYPAPTGCINVAGAIWQSPEAACKTLGDLGIDVVGIKEIEIGAGTDLGSLYEDLCGCSPFVSCTPEKWVVPDVARSSSVEDGTGRHRGAVLETIQLGELCTRVVCVQCVESSADWENCDCPPTWTFTPRDFVVFPTPTPGGGGSADPDRDDNLSSIRGIGNNAERVLRAGGITSFARLASSSVDELQKLFPRLGDARRNPKNLAAWMVEANKRT